MKKITNNNMENLTTLRMEYQRLCTEITSTERSSDKIVGLGISIITAGFAYGIAKNVNEVFFFLPIATVGVFLYATMQYNRIFWMGGYKRFLEDRINNLIGENILVWEKIVRVREKRHFINSSLFVVYTVLFISIVAFSSFKIFATYPGWVGAIFALILAGIMILLLLSIHRVWKSFDQAYQTAQELSTENKTDI